MVMTTAMAIVMAIAMTILMTMVTSYTMTTQMMGALPFPKQQYTPEQRASEAIVYSQK
jgi:hypothetical protein